MAIEFDEGIFQTVKFNVPNFKLVFLGLNSPGLNVPLKIDEIDKSVS